MTTLKGRTAPELKLETTTDAIWDLADHRGTPMLVVFLRHLG